METIKMPGYEGPPILAQYEHCALCTVHCTSGYVCDFIKKKVLSHHFKTDLQSKSMSCMESKYTVALGMYGHWSVLVGPLDKDISGINSLWFESL